MGIKPTYSLTYVVMPVSLGVLHLILRTGDELPSPPTQRLLGDQLLLDRLRNLRVS
jgi:hypothetical protein